MESGFGKRITDRVAMPSHDAAFSQAPQDGPVDVGVVCRAALCSGARLAIY